MKYNPVGGVGSQAWTRKVIRAAQQLGITNQNIKDVLRQTYQAYGNDFSS